MPDNAVVQPLRRWCASPRRTTCALPSSMNSAKRKPFEICQKKIAEHGLDMKLVDVECNFEGTKTMFFFTFRRAALTSASS